MSKKNLHVMMTADAKDLETKVGRMESMLKGLEGRTAGMRAGMAAIVGGANPFDILKGGAENLIGSIPKIGPALQAGLHVADSFYHKIKDTLKDVVTQGKHALGLGASIEGYSALRLAVGDAEALDKALFKLSDATAEAAMNGGATAEAFERLHLDAGQLSAMKTDQQFLKVAGALSKVENASLRNKTAMDIFGKSALAIMPDLMKGEKGLQKWMDFYKQRGAVTTTSDFLAAKESLVAMKQLDAQIDGIWKKLAVGFAPLVKTIAEDLQKWRVGGAQDLSEDKLGTSLNQWYFMAKDLFSSDFWTLKPHLSALDQAKIEQAKFAAEVKKGLEDEKRQAEALKRAADEQKRLAEEAKKQEEINRRVQAVVDAGLTPWEKFERKIAEVNDVAAMGRLSWEQYYAALHAAVNEFDKFEKQKNEYHPNTSLDFGTAGEFSARLRFQRDGEQAAATSGNRVEDFLKQIRDHSRDTKKAAQETAEALKKLGIAKF